MSGQDLSNYLQNLPAEQIDRIDIITNPGAKYEAQGNAGIIDIRLKKTATWEPMAPSMLPTFKENIRNTVHPEPATTEIKT